MDQIELLFEGLQVELHVTACQYQAVMVGIEYSFHALL